MASRFILPLADVGNGISPSDGATLDFFITGSTTTRKDTFSDEALTIANANPVVANADGVFPDIWLPDGGRYKVILNDKNNVQIDESDPVVGGVSPDITSKAFATIAAMVASIEINAGDIIETAEHTLDAGGEGGNKYLARAVTGGTADNGSLIKSTGDLTIEFVGLFPGGVVTLKQFGVLADGSTDDTAAFQAAIDYGNSLNLGGSVGGGGTELLLPEGKLVYTGITLKQGVTFRGQGQNVSLLMLSGSTSTGFKCAAADTQLVADQISRGHFKDFGMFSNEASPASQVQWNITGFSRWLTEGVFIEWFGGCNGIELIDATLAGSGGPTQFYNEFHHCFLVRAASRPSGGIALNLGDTDTGKEQITSMTWLGGRIAGSNPATGTGLALRGTGNRFYGVVFEGLQTACAIGSAGTRGAATNSFFGCYWEGNTTNRQMLANASFTKFFGSFVTGGVDSDSGSQTTFDDGGNFRGFSGNSGSQRWEVEIESGGTRRPKFIGSTAPSIGLENSAGTELIFANGSASSLGDSYGRFFEDGFVTPLLEFGKTNAKFQAVNIKLRNDTGFGIFTGAGTPEGSVSADVGSTFMRTDGGAGTSFYVKESGTGNTGWVAK